MITIERKHIIGLIIFIILMIFLTKQFRIKERFTMLAGLNPLTSYDDDATYQNEFALDNLPYWDDFNYAMAYRLRDIVDVDDTYGLPVDKDGYIINDKEYAKRQLAATQCGSEDLIHKYKEDYDKDGFFNYRGRKVRQKLIPGNYASWAPEYDGSKVSENYSPARFDQNNLTLVENPNRTRFNTNFAFQGSNIYYDNND